MRNSLTGPLMLMLLAVVSSAAQGPAGPRKILRTDVLGCYALYTAAGKLLDTSYHNASPRVRLDSASMAIERREFLQGFFRRLVRLDSTGHVMDTTRRYQMFRNWSADSLTDSLRLSFSDGFSGAHVILAAPPGHLDTLRGRVEERWDFQPTNQRGVVYALPVRCRGAA